MGTYSPAPSVGGSGGLWHMLTNEPVSRPPIRGPSAADREAPLHGIAARVGILTRGRAPWAPSVSEANEAFMYPPQRPIAQPLHRGLEQDRAAGFPGGEVG